jgi:hypothetical protein
MDTDPTTQKNKESLYHVVKMTEGATGRRYCLSCNKVLPITAFKTLEKRFKCRACFRTMNKEFFSTNVQRLHNSLLCRARRDKDLFGHPKISLSLQELLEIMTADQVRDFSAWVVVPKQPSMILTKDNAKIIPSFQRKFLLAEWRKGNDHKLYTQNLETLPPHSPGAKS